LSSSILKPSKFSHHISLLHSVRSMVWKFNKKTKKNRRPLDIHISKPEITGESESVSTRSCDHSGTQSSGNCHSCHQGTEALSTGSPLSSECNNPTTYMSGATSDCRVCSSNSTTDPQDRRKVPRNVTFSDVSIRDYERVVGDNPSCSSGPSVG